MLLAPHEVRNLGVEVGPQPLQGIELVVEGAVGEYVAGLLEAEAHVGQVEGVAEQHAV